MYGNAIRHTALALLLAVPGLCAGADDLGQRIAQHDGWNAWRVPMVDGAGTPCCFDWHDHGGKAISRGACDLDGHSWNLGTNDADPRPALAQDLDVYVHVTGAAIDKVRAFGASCSIRNGDQVRRLDGVTSADSIALLTAAALQAKSEDVADTEIAALALHADAGATTALQRLAGTSNPRKLREQALFWLGQARGAEGAKFVESVATGNDDAELRANAVFDLSQSHAVDAYASIRAIAHNDRSEHVREQALFWMAQMGDKRAKDDIFAAIAHDVSDKVREQAVFALSQLENGEADAALIALVRGNYPRKVKEQALFWLGQSGSTRAMDFLDEVLAGSAGKPARR
jgi:HEAT repeats